MKDLRHRSSVMLALLWLLIADVAIAGDYTLIMGRTLAVCQHMLKLFNEDLKTFGELQYGQHEEFTSIQWTLALEDYCRRVEMAQFDIDDDGHDDTVLKYAGCLRGVLDDALYIYDQGKNAPAASPHFTFNVDVLKQASGLIGQFPHGQYELRELPKLREGTAEFYRYIGTPLRLNPFRFGGQYYLVLDDPFHFLKKGGKRFTAIVHTDKQGHLTDLCYFSTKTFVRR